MTLVEATMSRIAPLLAVAVASALVLVVPAAGEAAQAVHGGWKVSWPSTAKLKRVAPGTTLRVVVAPAKGRRAPARRARVTITLTRVGDGRTLQRRTLRRGVLAIRLPAATGVRYRLTAKAGTKLLRRATLVIPAPARAPQQQQAEAPDPPVPSCAPGVRSEGPASGTFVGDKRAIRYGETLTMTFTNTSRAACLAGGVGFDVERSDGGPGWTPARLNVAVPAVGVLLMPGRSSTISFTADDSLFETGAGDFPLQPGRYRIRQHWQAVTTVGGAIDGTWEFELTLDDDTRCGQPTRLMSARPTFAVGRLWGSGLVGIFNEGGVCLRVPAQVTLERVLGDGTTVVAATLTRAQCTSDDAILTPNRSAGYDLPVSTVTPLLEPGRYRFTTTAVAVPAGGADQALPVTIDFDLAEPISGGGAGPIGCAVP